MMLIHHRPAIPGPWCTATNQGVVTSQPMLVGYESCQGSGPLLLYGDDSLRHVVPPVHQKSLKNAGREYIPKPRRPIQLFSVFIADFPAHGRAPWSPMGQSAL